MVVPLYKVPVGCFFVRCALDDVLCYKDYPTKGTDTNFCIISFDMHRGIPYYRRGYIMNSFKYLCEIVDERFNTCSDSHQLSLF